MPLPRLARLALIVAALAPPASAAEALDPAGLVPLPVTVANAGPAAIACEAEVAHWFALALGTVAPGAAAPLDLWRDPATGTRAVRNARGEFLPLERAWCGLAGQAYATRWPLPLTPDTTALAVACAPEGARLVCR
jgi:hypothetical protein